MNKFRVVITEVVRYELEVEATDADAAEIEAVYKFADSDDPNQWFAAVEERDIHVQGTSLFPATGLEG